VGDASQAVNARLEAISKRVGETLVEIKSVQARLDVEETARRIAREDMHTAFEGLQQQMAEFARLLAVIVASPRVYIAPQYEQPRGRANDPDPTPPVAIGLLPALLVPVSDLLEVPLLHGEDDQTTG
jgi:hypothetical protein